MFKDLSVRAKTIKFLEMKGILYNLRFSNGLIGNDAKSTSNTRKK